MNTSKYLENVKKYIKKPWVIALIIVVLLIVIFSIRGGSSKVQAEIYTVKAGTVSEGVSVTGKVKAAQAVDLSFERSGKVTKINKNVGDRVTAGELIIQLDNREAGADLAQAQAALKVQQSKLAELIESNGSEQVDLSKSKTLTAQADLDNAKSNLVSALQDAYSSADDAIRNRIDEFFINPRTQNPQIAFASKITPETSLESGRVEVEARLQDMKNMLPTLKATSDLTSVTASFKNDLGQIKLFLDNLSLAVNSLTGTEDYLTPTKVATWKADMSAARTEVNTSITGVLGAENKLTASQGNFDLTAKQLSITTTGSATKQIDAQRALVAQAEANVASSYAQYTKTSIKAPISGIVTKQTAELGETVIANTIVTSVISDAQFEIEANIPEADIAKVSVGDEAKVTLDAYGSDTVFNARVVAVDPAETVIDGVPTYKTTFQFEGADDRIKSGMTANVDIQGQIKENVLYVPQRAITSKNGQKFVTIKSGDTTQDIEIKTGIRGIDGSVEVTDGLKSGDNVVINTK